MPGLPALAEAGQEALTPGGKRFHPLGQRPIVTGQQQLESVVDAAQLGGGIGRNGGQRLAHPRLLHPGGQLRIQQCQHLFRCTATTCSSTGEQTVPFGRVQRNVQCREGGGELIERGHWILR